MKSTLHVLVFFISCLVVSNLSAEPVKEQRLQEVAERGRRIMPFDLQKTLHLFIKSATGGTQQVIVKQQTDEQQIRLIRQHLLKIAKDFEQGDFNDPISIHGQQMPGIGILSQAQQGQLNIRYSDLPGGGEIRYVSNDSLIITAIHRWFDAQLADHGHHAISGQHEAMHSKANEDDQ